VPFLTGRTLASAACLLVFSTALARTPSGSTGQARTGEEKAGLASYEREISDWRMERNKELTSEDGWLALVGLSG
jgi:hypothetical protein